LKPTLSAFFNPGGAIEAGDCKQKRIKRYLHSKNHETHFFVENWTFIVKTMKLIVETRIKRDLHSRKLDILNVENKGFVILLRNMSFFPFYSLPEELGVSVWGPGP